MREGCRHLDINKKVMITGASGFIGFHLSKALIEKGIAVIGIDNMNDYYDVRLKHRRLDILKGFERFKFIKSDIADKEGIQNIFAEHRPDIVVNLAAQAGVRYSIENPDAYISSNIIGFFNILECCRFYPVEHLIYASSSSIYGRTNKIPFSSDDKTDKPVSLYATTKKSNELMAYSYSHLHNIPATGLRFFTVYGPYGRPDMAYFSFTKKILAGEGIQVYNNGDMYRDFTYIDDVITAVLKVIPNPPVPDENAAKYKVYNIGNNKPEKLTHFIEVLERCIGKKARIEYLPMQAGDIYQTCADVVELMEDFDFRPSTPITEGLAKFVEWYKAK